MLNKIYEKLVKFLLEDGYSIDLSDKDMKNDASKYNALYSVTRFAVNHLTNTHIPKALSFNSEKDSEEFKNTWESIEKLTPDVFHKFKHGSIYSAVIVHADDLSSLEIQDIAAIAEKNALNTRRFALHSDHFL